jgi:cystathionine beta-lyase
MEFDAIERRGTGAIKWDDTQRRFGRDDLLPLWVADMDIAAPQVIQDALTQRAKHPVYGYTLFSERFYAAIAWWYAHHFDWKIDTEWIVPDHGVVVSINTAIAAFSEPGDGVLIQTPIYPPFMSSILDNNRTMLENRLIYEKEHYTIDWDDFETKASEAKLFILCSPHNPTTRAWSEDELTQMASICNKHNVVIVADEIHSDVVHARQHVSIGNLPEAKEITLTLHAPSKTFNIAGLNTSYAIIPNAKLRKAYQKRYTQMGLPHGNSFGIAGLEAAYTPEGAAWLERLMQYLQGNIGYVQTYFQERIPQIIPLKSEATFLIWLDCRALDMDDDELENLFFDQARLALNKGVGFGEAGSGFMRLNIGTSRAILKEALERLESALAEREG